MTQARSQPILRKLGFNLGFYKRKENWPRNITERNIALKLHNNHFYLIWKSEGIIFHQGIIELEDNFKIVDKYMTKEKVNSHFEYIYQPQNIESHLTNFITNDLETHNTDRTRPYVFCFYRLSKLAGKIDRNLTQYEIDICKKDTIAFDGDDCVTKVLDFCLKLKNEKR